MARFAGKGALRATRVENEQARVIVVGWDPLSTKTALYWGPSVQRTSRRPDVQTVTHVTLCDFCSWDGGGTDRQTDSTSSSVTYVRTAARSGALPHTLTELPACNALTYESICG